MIFDFLSRQAKITLRKEYGVKYATVSWQRPAQVEHGDVATSIALQLAKAVQKKPAEIAKVLCEALGSLEEVERAEVAGPGYVNVWLTSTALFSALRTSRASCTSAPVRSEEAPVILEYSQPNIAKPLGIHHILSTVIGQSLSNLYRHGGFHTLTINHIGDWGTQFGKLSVAMKKWGTKRIEECTIDDLLSLYVRFHEEAESNPALEDEGREAFRLLEQGDKDLRHFWQEVVSITMKDMERIYSRLHVSFDHTMGESFYEDKMTPVITEGKKKGVFTEGEKGSLIAAFPEADSMPPALIVKGDGATLYLTRDLATVRYRVDTWHPAAILYVVDVAQSLHFQQLFGIVHRLGWDLPTLEHVVFGRMRFADRKMSTRKGNILRLTEVLDEAVERARAVIAEHRDTIQTDSEDDLAEMMGTGAVVYGVLSQNRKMDMVFDWDKVLSFDGNSAPYVQYTHARARSVLRKAESDGMEMGDIPTLSQKERTLVQTLLLYPSVLDEARSAHMPHTLANYVYQLCQDYNAFYNAEVIVKAEEPARSMRLFLTKLSADVLRSGAEILTLRLPDRM